MSASIRVCLCGRRFDFNGVTVDHWDCEGLCDDCRDEVLRQYYIDCLEDACGQIKRGRMSSKRRLRRKGCTGKVQHKTRYRASCHAFNVKQANGTLLVPYKCRFCSFWHVASAKRIACGQIKVCVLCERLFAVTWVLFDSIDCDGMCDWCRDEALSQHCIDEGANELMEILFGHGLP